MNNLTPAIGLFAGLLLIGLSAGAQAPLTLNEAYKVVPPDGGSFDRFGQDVAIDANIVLAGAPFDDDRGDGSGSAYRFDAATGEFLGKLRFAQGRAEDTFGEGVAQRNGVTLIGAPGSSEGERDAGAAVQFTGSTQTNVFLPFAPFPWAPDFSAHGAALDLSRDGSTQIVGARGDTGHGDDGGANGGGGAAYITRAGQPTIKVFASDAGFADNFGFAVATSNDVAVGSAPFNDDNGNSSGSIYIYDVATGEERRKIVPDDVGTGDFFGSALAIDGNLIAASARFQSQPDGGAGAVYLFDATTGEELDKITVPGVFEVGIDVAMDGALLAIGAAEAAFVYDIGTGTMLAELAPSDPAAELFFGASIDITGRMVVVGAEGDESAGPRTGAAYVFAIPEVLDADGDGIADSADNCTDEANAAQLDGDNDGYGNACDADFNNDCIVNVQDLGILRTTFFGTDPVTDINSDGTVNVIDLGRLRALFFASPGPSAFGDCDG